MIDTIKKDFIQGIKTIKFWATILSERVKIEINVIRIVGEINKLIEKRDELLKSIGQEICESSLTEINKENEKIISLMRKVKELDTEIEDKKKKLSDLEEMSKWKF